MRLNYLTVLEGKSLRLQVCRSPQPSVNADYFRPTSPTTSTRGASPTLCTLTALTPWLAARFPSGWPILPSSCQPAGRNEGLRRRSLELADVSTSMINLGWVRWISEAIMLVSCPWCSPAEKVSPC